MIFNPKTEPKDITIDQLIVAGWTGRDSHAVNHHIKELAALGIKPPSNVPLYYRVSASLLVQSKQIQVLGNTSSGEVEPLLVKAGNQWWLGLGSDHTDRQLEAYSVAASKQACVKPVADTLWPLSTVEAHLDELILRCSILENNRWLTYQEGTLANIRPLSELIEAADLPDNSAMLCGTLGAIGGVRPAQHYKMSLEDPVSNHSIELEYQVDELPIIE